MIIIIRYEIKIISVIINGSNIRCIIINTWKFQNLCYNTDNDQKQSQNKTIRIPVFPSPIDFNLSRGTHRLSMYCFFDKKKEEAYTLFNLPNLNALLPFYNQLFNIVIYSKKKKK